MAFFQCVYVFWAKIGPKISFKKHGETCGGVFSFIIYLIVYGKNATKGIWVSISKKNNVKTLSEAEMKRHFKTFVDRKYMLHVMNDPFYLFINA